MSILPCKTKANPSCRRHGNMTGVNRLRRPAAAIAGSRAATCRRSRSCKMQTRPSPGTGLHGRVTVAAMAEIMDDFPTIPHEAAGVDCCGCIVVKVLGNDAELSCNECGAVVGVINRQILTDLRSLWHRWREDQIRIPKTWIASSAATQRHSSSVAPISSTLTVKVI